MKHLLMQIIVSCTLVSSVLAGQSVITEGEGYACMGEDKSRKATESSARADAKRKAAEAAATHIESETSVKDAMLEKDLLSAYAKAQVKVLSEFQAEWYKEQSMGDCFRVKLQVEVVPDEKVIAKLAKQDKSLETDPSAPLNVKIWTDRPKYADSECMRIYLRGNKPFYGRVLYTQADGTTVQLLPNPYRNMDYFRGGVVYELPSGEDRFKMETCAPFGAERIILTASTAPVGELEVKPAGAVYLVSKPVPDILRVARGVRIKANEDGSAKTSAEFSEAVVDITTGPAKNR